MRDQSGKEVWMAAAECADRLGLTVRALRVYEQRGLIAPKRTEKGWRLYGGQEIARLHEILALKRLGLSLSRISELLKGHAIDLDRTLAMQQSILLQLRERVEQSLSLINAARTKLSVGDVLSTNELISLVKETKMTDAVPDTIAWRRYEQARPRTEYTVNPGLLEKYAGLYQFENGPIFAITSDKDRLLAKLENQMAVELFAESDKKFFLKAVAAQISFLVLEAGKASALVLHQNGLEQKADRVDEAAAKVAADYVAARIAANKPIPESKTVLQRTILDLQRGEPDYDQMSALLAAIVREQLPTVSPHLRSMGALKEVSVKRVGRKAGADVYDAAFENGKLEWHLKLDANGKITGLRMRT
ncbi:MerR family transcriptional regulator [Terrarubrum flagellatum]|uniref:MerR family transcriptional regulator n=1 Tax=Terrirubrum flagellatum TaxID=2895980 RepID=UPI0031454681